MNASALTGRSGAIDVSHNNLQGWRVSLVRNVQGETYPFGGRQRSRTSDIAHPGQPQKSVLRGADRNAVVSFRLRPFNVGALPATPLLAP